MTAVSRCPLCDSTVSMPSSMGQRDIVRITCETCGSFAITPEAANALQQPDVRDKLYVLSGLTRTATENEQLLELTTYSIPDLLNSAPLPKTPFDAIERLLLLIRADTKSITGAVKLLRTDYPLIFARSADELGQTIDHLVDLGYVTRQDETEHVQVALTLKGWKAAADLRRAGRSSKRAFVAMSFSPDLSAAWENGIKLALTDAGFDAIRVDLVEHNEKICDLIIGEVRRSGLLVADFTGNRHGVYFEAGFALGLGIPVIWCVKTADLEDVHFDTRQYNHVVWETPEELRSKLYNRLIATIPASKGVTH